MTIDITERTLSTLFRLAMLDERAEIRVEVMNSRFGKGVCFTMRLGDYTLYRALPLCEFVYFKSGASNLYRLVLNNMKEEIVSVFEQEKKSD